MVAPQGTTQKNGKKKLNGGSYCFTNIIWDGLWLLGLPVYHIIVDTRVVNGAKYGYVPYVLPWFLVVRWTWEGMNDDEHKQKHIYAHKERY